MTSPTDGVNIVEVWNLIAEKRKLFLSVVGAFFILGLILCVVLPKNYQSKASILPAISGQDGVGKTTDQLGAIAGLLGADFGRSSSTKILISVLKSRTLGDRVIERLKLWDQLVPQEPGGDASETANLKRREIAYRIFSSKIKIKEDKELPTIVLTATFNDPDTASAVLTTYLDELQHFLNSSTMTIAKRNRQFIEDRLVENDATLLRLGTELAQFYQRNAVSNAHGSLDVVLNKNDPSGISKESIPTRASHTIKNVPNKVYFEHLSSQREILRNVNGLLSTQREIARIDEVKEEISFQTLDAPKSPALPSGPRKIFILAIFSFLGLILAFSLVYASQYWHSLKKAKNSRSLQEAIAFR